MAEMAGGDDDDDDDDGSSYGRFVFYDLFLMMMMMVFFFIFSLSTVACSTRYVTYLNEKKGWTRLKATHALKQV